MQNKYTGLQDFLIEEVKKILDNYYAFGTPVVDESSGILYYIKRISNQNNEFEILKRIDDSHLPHIKTFIDWNGLKFVLLPYKGTRIDHFIRSFELNPDPRFNIQNICNAFRDLGRSLEYFHSIKISPSDNPQLINSKEFFVTHGDILARNITAIFYGQSLFLSLIDFDRAMLFENNRSVSYRCSSEEDWCGLLDQFIKCVEFVLSEIHGFYRSSLYKVLQSNKSEVYINKETFYEIIGLVENSSYYES